VRTWGLTVDGPDAPSMVKICLLAFY